MLRANKGSFSDKNRGNPFTLKPAEGMPVQKEQDNGKGDRHGFAEEGKRKENEGEKIESERMSPKERNPNNFRRAFLNVF